MQNAFQQWRGEVFASIDLGTNNCRLMIAKPTAEGFYVIDSYSQVTRLGEGLVSNEVLSEKAMERTFKALEKCKRKLSKYQITRSHFVATEACRRAKNGVDFMADIKKKLGLDFDIVTPEQESALSVAGCLPLVKPKTKTLIVFDIGGGSSEISVSNVKPNGDVDVIGVISLPIGVLTVSEGFTGTDISDRAKKTIEDKVTSAMAAFDAKHKVHEKIQKGAVQIIGTSGTVTCLGAFHLDLPRYNRNAVDGLTMSFEQVNKALKNIAGLSNLERIAHPCIGPQRGLLTSAGCVILDAICNFWKIDELTVADRGLREGILLDLIHKYKAETK